jgi:hypothetical protein
MTIVRPAPEKRLKELKALSQVSDPEVSVW